MVHSDSDLSPACQQFPSDPLQKLAPEGTPDLAFANTPKDLATEPVASIAFAQAQGLALIHILPRDE